VSGGQPWSARGAHFLSRALAARLVAEADVDPDDLVFDLGAGHGAITEALAASGARIIAVERDPKLVRQLERRFAAAPQVRVVHGDLRTIPLPRKHFRVVANIPFGITTELLGRLLNAGLESGDIVVADGVSRMLTATRPGRARVLRWTVDYEFRRGRALPARCFRPVPSVDAATLLIRRRPRPLVVGTERRAFEQLLKSAGNQPWDRAIRPYVTHRQAVRIAAERSLQLGRPATELSVHDWAAIAKRSD
jgi:23S rRNA (adenine-N6)-dimethyltransferase